MNVRRDQNALMILVVVSLVSVFLLLRTSEPSQPDRIAPASPTPVAPTPQVTLTPTPQANLTPTPAPKERFLYVRPRPAEVIDDARAPDWFTDRSYYLDADRFHKRDEGVWLFQHNHRRVVPGRQDGLGWCTPSQQYYFVEEHTIGIMQELLGNWYRYEVAIESRSDGITETETDLTKFRVYVATTEYHPPEWREQVLKRLVKELGLSPHQIELTVPPAEKTGTDQWVEGKSDSLFDRNRSRT